MFFQLFMGWKEMLNKLLSPCEGVHQSLMDSNHKEWVMQNLKFLLSLKKSTDSQFDSDLIC